MRLIVIAVILFVAAFAGHVAESGEPPAQAVTPGNAVDFAGEVMAEGAAGAGAALRDVVPQNRTARSEINRRTGR